MTNKTPKSKTEICKCGHEYNSHRENGHYRDMNERGGKCIELIEKGETCPCTHFVPKTRTEDNHNSQSATETQVVNDRNKSANTEPDKCLSNGEKLRGSNPRLSDSPFQTEICKCGHEKNRHTYLDNKFLNCELEWCGCTHFVPQTEDNHIEPDEPRASEKNDAVSRIDGSPNQTNISAEIEKVKKEIEDYNFWREKHQNKDDKKKDIQAINVLKATLTAYENAERMHEEELKDLQDAYDIAMGEIARLREQSLAFDNFVKKLKEEIDKWAKQQDTKDNFLGVRIYEISDTSFKQLFERLDNLAKEFKMTSSGEKEFKIGDKI